jgi:predicted Ser/Thr protein kinase
MERISTLTVADLRQLAAKFKLPGRTKRELVHALYAHSCDLQKHVAYTFIKQLGVEGKDGRTFLVEDKHGHTWALKLFKRDKNPEHMQREVDMQRIAADAGVAPRIVDYNIDGRFIVMEKLDRTLYDFFRAQEGQLTVAQQKAMVSLFKRLDTCGVLHNDPNPLNFLKKGRCWYAIDYGFAKRITDRVRARFGAHPNAKAMTLGLVLQLRRIHPEAQLEYLESQLA